MRLARFMLSIITLGSLVFALVVSPVRVLAGKVRIAMSFSDSGVTVNI